MKTTTSPKVDLPAERLIAEQREVIERMAVERDANLRLLDAATKECERLKVENLKLKLQAANAKFAGYPPPKQFKDPSRGP